MTSLLATLLIALATVSVARAEAEQTLVLVNAPALFIDAVEKALAPWPIRVQTLRSEVSLTESMPGARKSASSICEQEKSGAVVWLTSNDEGQAIWMYDATDDRVVVRELLVSQPLDEAGAASAALSVKALLMHSHSAPASERFGAQAVAESVPLVPMPKEQWAAEGFLGVQQGLNGDSFAEARMGLGLLYRLDEVELGARLSFGSGYAIGAPELAGSFSQQELSLLMRYPISVGAYQLGASLRPGLQRGSLQGTLVASAAPVKETRLNPSMGIGIDLSRDFGSLRLGVGLSSTYMLRSQRYLVAGKSVLDLAEIDMILGTSVAFWLP